MFEQILNGVMPIITQGVISVLGILLTIAISQATQYLSIKKQAVVEKIGVDQYNFYQSLAESIFYGIEQQMKTSSGKDKKGEFDKRLMAKIPGLTQDELDHLREGVVGKARSAASKLLERPAAAAPQIQNIQPAIPMNPIPMPVYPPAQPQIHYQAPKVTTDNKKTTSGGSTALPYVGLTDTTIGGGTLISSGGAAVLGTIAQSVHSAVVESITADTSDPAAPINSSNIITFDFGGSDDVEAPLTETSESSSGAGVFGDSVITESTPSPESSSYDMYSSTTPDPVSKPFYTHANDIGMPSMDTESISMPDSGSNITD